MFKDMIRNKNKQKITKKVFLKKMSRKAQVSIEYLIIIAVILAALSPFVYKEINKQVTKSRVNDANKAINDISTSADTLYSLGPGNQKYIYLDIPEGVTDVDIYKRELTITIDTPEGIKEIMLTTKGYVTGVIPMTSGMHKVQMRVLETGEVLIGDPYCSLKSVDECNAAENIVPVLYLHSNVSSTHASLYHNLTNGTIVANYTLCCKNTISGSYGGRFTYNTTMVRLSDNISAHVAEKDYTPYLAKAEIFYPSEYGNPVPECKYTNETIQFCAEFGPDYQCIMTIGNERWNSTSLPEPMITNSHVSDCDGDWDDLSTKVCCVIPP
jgi:uncharacterized protein (UPF0333 family)